MAQNITLLGASYSAVPAVYLPKTGGGTARFTDVTDTTAAASDVAVGKYFYDANGTKTEGTNSGGGGGAAISIVDEPLPGGGTAKHITGVDISSDTVDAAHLAQGYTAHDASGTAIVGTMSGGGGASNIVIGEFTPDEEYKGYPMTVNISYTGSGYPVAVMIYPSEGAYDPDGTYYNTIQRYALHTVAIVKDLFDEAPTYGYTTTGADKASIVVRYKNSTSSSTSITQSGTTSANLFTTVDPSAMASSCVRFTSATTMKILVADTSYGFMADIPYTYHIVYSA